MCGVTDLDDACGGRRPLRLWVSPEKFEVNDSVWRRDVDELLEDGRPLVLFHAGHVVHAIEHLILLDGVIPALFFRAGDL